MIGFAGKSKVLNCYNTSEVYLNKVENLSYYRAGGVCGGINEVQTVVENCYNIGNITITQSITSGYLRSGGIAGQFFNGGNLNNSYNAGNITFVQTDRSGIIVGECNTGAKAEKCYSLDSVANMDGISLCNFIDGGGSLTNCSALTDEYMKSQDFVNDLNNGETEGELAWKLNPNGGYPLLWWQK